MRAILAALALAGVLLILQWIEPASAHDSWISHQSMRNAAGEWCCGEGDCFELDAGDVITTFGGWRIKSLHETIPYSETQPSPDGHFWCCQRADGSRRCFFGPPSSW